MAVYVGKKKSIDPLLIESERVSEFGMLIKHEHRYRRVMCDSLKYKPTYAYPLRVLRAVTRRTIFSYCTQVWALAVNQEQYLGPVRQLLPELVLLCQLAVALAECGTRAGCAVAPRRLEVIGL